ncbi:hypothetical protein N656DRAFT_797436 [Canariomyces notabilis]|uniref:Uncharacterized protein n=1 Tax=Canariomyces notabilis TaxID=2074819 RepID=A0AAN6YTG1_9PEZI|nr:hypothetical protein N656DRAFT_797436 [Canariomyces arenarius]
MSLPPISHSIEVHGSAARTEEGTLKATPKGFGTVLTPEGDPPTREERWDWVHLPLTLNTRASNHATKKIIPVDFTVRFAKGAKAQIDGVHLYQANDLFHRHLTPFSGTSIHDDRGSIIPEDKRVDVNNGMGITLKVTIQGGSANDPDRWLTVSSAAMKFAEVDRRPSPPSP